MSIPGGDASDIITQVSQTSAGVDVSTAIYEDDWHKEMMNEPIRVNARGVTIEMARRELSRLPQCILVGIANSMPQGIGSINNILMADINEPPIPINFPPEFLIYTLMKFREMEREDIPRDNQRDSLGTLDISDMQGQGPGFIPGPQNLAEAIRTNPAVIVLREDLDFYCLPPTPDISKKRMNEIKRAAGAELVSKYNTVLTGLKKSSTPGSPEAHLIEMLCSTGFRTDERWGYRQMEPGKTVVSSLALVRLRTDYEDEESQETPLPETPLKTTNETSSNYAQPLAATQSTASNKSSDTISTTASLHTVPESPPHESSQEPAIASAVTATELPPSPPHADDVNDYSSSSSSSSSSDEEEDHVQQAPQSLPPAVDLAKSQKLFLFWRKPARKCWWDTILFDDLELPPEDNPNGEKVKIGQIKVHIRSVWTLELCIVD